MPKRYLFLDNWICPLLVNLKSRLFNSQGEGNLQKKMPSLLNISIAVGFTGFVQISATFSARECLYPLYININLYRALQMSLWKKIWWLCIYVLCACMKPLKCHRVPLSMSVWLISSMLVESSLWWPSWVAAPKRFVASAMAGAEEPAAVATGAVCCSWLRVMWSKRRWTAAKSRSRS